MTEARARGGIGRWLIPLLGVGALFAAPMGWWIHTWAPQDRPDRLVAIDVADSFKRTPQLAQVTDRGVLRVATLIEPTVYIPDSYRPQGLEYDLTGRFAERLGVKVDYVVVESIEAAYKAVADNRVDLAAAGLAIDPAREERFVFSPPYLTVSRKLIHAVDRPTPEDLAEIAGETVAVPAGSASQSWLERIGREPNAVPLTIEERPDKLSILEGIRHGKIEYALTLSHTALLAHKLSDDVVIGP
ncbi:MAG TPA: transporter substrate-binding domain-containing protein, partial [Chromatiales bacterium]|nr:transporter substrate-binding domain-containing protein [Chromatiales bacterium]